MEKNKNVALYYWVISIAVIVAIVIFWSMSRKDKSSTLPNVEQNVQDTTQSTLDTNSVKKKTGVAISYADALVKYKDRRIQFDKICQAIPNAVTYKDNTGIMLDNRSGETRTIKVGTSYTVKAYDFKIVVLPDIYLKSKNLFVDCDKSRNVATILLQE